MDIVNFLFESIESEHLTQRFEGRINQMPSNAIPNKIKRQIFKNLKRVENIDFGNKSYGIRLAELQINPNSEMFLDIKGRKYYRINDFLGKDSTGNEIWVIIRRNKIGTIMLRKDIQPLEKLRVDKVIKNVKELKNM